MWQKGDLFNHLPSFFGRASPFPNAPVGLVSRWTWELNQMDLGNVPSGVLGPPSISFFHPVNKSSLILISWMQLHDIITSDWTIHVRLIHFFFLLLFLLLTLKLPVCLFWLHCKLDHLWNESVHGSRLIKAWCTTAFWHTITEGVKETGRQQTCRRTELVTFSLCLIHQTWHTMGYFPNRPDSIVQILTPDHQTDILK